MASPAEQEHKLKQFEGLTEEYMEKIIELGYIMMFAAASPVRYVFPLLIWPFHRAPTLPLSVLHTHARARAHTHTHQHEHTHALYVRYLPPGFVDRDRHACALACVCVRVCTYVRVCMCVEYSFWA